MPKSSLGERPKTDKASEDSAGAFPGQATVTRSQIRGTIVLPCETEKRTPYLSSKTPTPLYLSCHLVMGGDGWKTE
jgi:hypothetical protein